jgi:hypothetical protein
MTSQTRHYIDLEDLLGLHLGCKDCSTSIDLEIAKVAQLPQNCPNCGRRWMAPNQGDMRASTPFYALISGFLAEFTALKNAMDSKIVSPPFHISLEVAGPTATKVPSVSLSA